jgi:hypothetical protein
MAQDPRRIDDDPGGGPIVRGEAFYPTLAAHVPKSASHPSSVAVRNSTATALAGIPGDPRCY